MNENLEIPFKIFVKLCREEGEEVDEGEDEDEDEEEDEDEDEDWKKKKPEEGEEEDEGELEDRLGKFRIELPDGPGASTIAKLMRFNFFAKTKTNKGNMPMSRWKTIEIFKTVRF